MRAAAAWGLVAVLAAPGCGDDGAATHDGGDPADGAPPPPTCVDGGGTGADATVPGASALPSPTLRHLTVEWLIDGDDDLDGVVSVRFREAGAQTWRAGLALRRIPAGTNAGFGWANRHAGSVFGLAPGTAYEVELALSDPDSGCEVRTLTATTRPVPAPMAGAPVIAVTPASFAAEAAAAGPGDILELGAGDYPTFTFAQDGAPGMPIVIRSSAGAVITGDVRLDGRKHVHVVGLTVQGKIKFNDGEDLAIVGNTITTTEDGITTKTRAENCYIADNVVTGATAWNEAALGASGANIGEGIEVTGPGHVIEHNRVIGFRDGISLLEDGGASDQHSIDIVGNDIQNAADDGIEADFCFHDCRVIDNRLTNVFMGVSSQPGLGGPTWFVRNVMHNVVLSPFKLQRGSVGDVALHNTVVKSGDALGIYTPDVFSRQWFRNNLFLGGPGGTHNGYDTGPGNVLELRSADVTGDYDHDGFGSTAAMFTGRLGAVAFTSVDELRAMTSEVHAVVVTPAVFAAAVAVPIGPFPAVAPGDLRLAATGAATDVGVPLSNINDGFAGSAPDLGAYEAGASLPSYGPR